MELTLSNIKAVIAYDGLPYLGFKKTGSKNSIEDHLLTAIKKVTQKDVKIQGASRTDSSVHANGQVINFFLHQKIPLEKLKTALNANLPKEIRILTINQEADDFHPTLSCKLKTYHYYIDNASVQNPFSRHKAWYIHEKLNIESMQKAADTLIGRHDFSAFAAKGHHENTIRELQSITITRNGPQIMIAVCGVSFLYKMVRGIVGTLVYVGQGKISLNEFKNITTNKDRKQAGPSAPAYGLFLHQIDY